MACVPDRVLSSSDWRPRPRRYIKPSSHCIQKMVHGRSCISFAKQPSLDRNLLTAQNSKLNFPLLCGSRRVLIPGSRDPEISGSRSSFQSRNPGNFSIQSRNFGIDFYKVNIMNSNEIIAIRVSCNCKMWLTSSPWVLFTRSGSWATVGHCKWTCQTLFLMTYRSFALILGINQHARIWNLLTLWRDG